LVHKKPPQSVRMSVVASSLEQKRKARPKRIYGRGASGNLYSIETGLAALSILQPTGRSKTLRRVSTV